MSLEAIKNKPDIVSENMEYSAQHKINVRYS